jgi:hypothetical protein
MVETFWENHCNLIGLRQVNEVIFYLERNIWRFW